MNCPIGSVGFDKETTLHFFVDGDGRRRSVTTGAVVSVGECGTCSSGKEHTTYYNDKDISDALDIISVMGKYSLNL